MTDAAACVAPACPTRMGATCYEHVNDARCFVTWVEDDDSCVPYLEWAAGQPAPAPPRAPVPRGPQPRRTTRAQRKTRRG